MTNVDVLQGQLGTLWDPKTKCFRDLEAVRGILAELVDVVLRDTRSLDEAAQLLEFWVPRSADLAGWFASVCDVRERSLQEECQQAEKRCQEARAALNKRHLWLEKLIRIANIQRLERDPRLQAYAQVEGVRGEIQQTQQEITETEDALRARLAHLRSQL